MTEQAEGTRCLRCGRKLTRSIGYGPVCRARIRAAEQAAPLADFTAAQLDKARQAIADGALVPTNREAVYRAVSSDGTTTYLVHPAMCGCPAGTRGLGRPCYHRAAVAILEAARPARRAA
jgi:hypothetical protein